MADPSESVIAVIVAELDATPTPTWAVGTNIFAGAMEAESTKFPRKCIWVGRTSSLPAWKTFGDRQNNSRRPLLSVWLREEHSELKGTLTARAETLYRILVRRRDLTGFFNCVPSEPSEVMMLPTDMPVIEMPLELWGNQG